MDDELLYSGDSSPDTEINEDCVAEENQSAMRRCDNESKFRTKFNGSSSDVDESRTSNHDQQPMDSFEENDQLTQQSCTSICNHTALLSISHEQQLSPNDGETDRLSATDSGSTRTPLIIISSDSEPEESVTCHRVNSSTLRKTKPQKRKRNVIDSDTDAYPNVDRNANDNVEGNTEEYFDDEFRVKSILGHKTVNDKTRYHIEWDGYPIEQATWEPFESLYCDDLWIDYVRKVNLTDKVEVILKSVEDKQDDKAKKRRLRVADENGFDRGLDADKILKICSRNNEKLCLVKFNGPHISEWISFDDVRKHRISLIADYMMTAVKFPEISNSQDTLDDTDEQKSECRDEKENTIDDESKSASHENEHTTGIHTVNECASNTREADNVSNCEIRDNESSAELETQNDKVNKENVKDDEEENVKDDEEENDTDERDKSESESGNDEMPDETHLDNDEVKKEENYKDDEEEPESENVNDEENTGDDGKSESKGRNEEIRKENEEIEREDNTASHNSNSSDEVEESSDGIHMVNEKVHKKENTGNDDDESDSESGDDDSSVEPCMDNIEVNEEEHGKDDDDESESGSHNDKSSDELGELSGEIGESSEEEYTGDDEDEADSECGDDESSGELSMDNNEVDDEGNMGDDEDETDSEMDDDESCEEPSVDNSDFDENRNTEEGSDGIDDIEAFENEDIEDELDAVELEYEEVEFVAYDPGETLAEFHTRLRTCSICNNSYPTVSESLNCFRSHDTMHLLCIICSTMIHDGEHATIGLYKHYRERHVMGERKNSIKCPFCTQEILYNEVFAHVSALHVSEQHEEYMKNT